MEQQGNIFKIDVLMRLLHLFHLSLKRSLRKTIEDGEDQGQTAKNVDLEISQ